MNEAMAIFLNMDEREHENNKALINRVDEFLLGFGIEYTGVRNVYKAIKDIERDHAVYAACHALRDAAWLKGKLAYLPVMHRTNACPMENIRLDYMQDPSAAKLKYYEEYYLESHTLAHGIIVDEHGQLRDGYTSYLIAKKYGIRPDICEAFETQPVRKIVRGRHVRQVQGLWKVKNDNHYIWNYTLRVPVIPGDILKVCTEKGPKFICVDKIDYVTGKEFCKEHKKVIKHMKERI